MAARRPCLNEIDVVVLAGGLGTRIRDVLGDTPKLLAPVGGRPFLDVLTARLRAFGARRLVLGLGHLADAVMGHLETHPPAGVAVVPVVEPAPLGTAGALRFLDARIESGLALVMNGDSFIGADLCDFVAAHIASGADASILCAQVDDTRAYGRVALSPEGRVLEFLEKDAAGAGPGAVNAGVYLLDAAIRARIREMEGPSLERDVFQALPPGTLNAVTSTEPFVDIGTPEGLARAADVLKPYLDPA